MQHIYKSFPVTDAEYELLNKQFGNLCEYQSWQLINRNNKNNHTSEQEDISQDLRIALLTAGCYYKRQTYIEKCLDLCSRYVRDNFLSSVVAELCDLWKNKTRHGAGRQKFGPCQEEMLDDLVCRVVPKEIRPSKSEPLQIDADFATYCKTITWNEQRALGKKITREKPLRDRLAPLSEYDYLAYV